MKRYVLPVALALAFAAPARAQKLSEAEAKDGFVSVFNDRDFSGWQFGGGYNLPEKLPKNWSVADGVIKLSGGGSPHLGTQWDYEDFDARFEWRALKPNYNSGFYVRSGRKVGANQINLAQKAAGNLMGGAKGGKGVPELQKEPGEWNEWRVLAVGDKLTFWCNGKLAWEVTGFKPQRGHLGLQAEGAAMEFRNFRIKELGYDNLTDLSKWKKSDRGDWKPDGDGFAASMAGSLEGGAPKEYVLRLEWKCGPKGLGRVGWGGGTAAAESVAVGRVDGGSGGQPDQKRPALKNTDNPVGQWNYLELRVAADKVSVWQNGAVVFERQSPNVGNVSLACAEGSLAFRNVRLKVLKK